MIGHILTAQIVASKEDVVEYNFFYCDSANDEFAYGDYEPKDLVKLNDGSLLIGTEFSISFPSQYSTPEKYDSTYFAKSKMFSQKSHTSSGSILKLNSNFEKEWETIFRGQRVERILKTKDDRLIIVGEDVSMKFVWLAEIDATGKLLWEKHYKYKNQVNLADAIVDEDNSIFLFLESSHIIPIKLTKYYGEKRLQLFKDSEVNSHLALLKISSEGKKNWLSPIDIRRKFDKFGYRLISNKKSIFASFTFEGFEKGRLIEGKKVVQLSKSGKSVSNENITKQEILLYKNGLITITSYSKGDLVLYNSGNKIDSIHIESADKDIRVENVINSSNDFLILGSNHDNNRDYLIINLNSNLKFNGYWTYPRDEYNEIRGAVILDNGETVIVGKCYREMKETSNRLKTYINLIKIKNGA